MKANRYILMASDDRWRIGVAGSVAPAILTLDCAGKGKDDGDPTAAARAAADRLLAEGYTGEGVILSIPSRWCLAAGISTSGLRRQSGHDAMQFRLEEKLPLAAEEVVADFVRHDDQIALGICAMVKELKRTVDALEDRGVAVVHICPTALLAAQSVARETGEPILLVWQMEKQAELVGLRNGRPVCWRVAPLDRHALEREVRAYRLGNPSAGPTEARNLDGRIAHLESSSNEPASSPWVAATRLGGSILDGREVPWIDLRRGALAVEDPIRQVHQPMTFFCAAVVACLLCTAAAVLWRDLRYRAMASAEIAAQHALFQEAYPSLAPPLDVTSRLQAEQRRLRVLGGGEAVSAKPSALQLLFDILNAIPRELRCRIIELRLEDGRLYMEGQARSHGDAEVLASALRHGGRFRIEPPRTEQRGELRGEQRGEQGGGQAAARGSELGGELGGERGGTQQNRAGVWFTLTGSATPAQTTRSGDPSVSPGGKP